MLTDEDEDLQALFYEKPSLIKNEGLLDEDNIGKVWLKSNLVEHFDFEVVCQKVWQHLVSWYSTDYIVCRVLI